MTQLVDAYSRWLSTSNVPKLFVNTDPGTILTGARREVVVQGYRSIQEDAPAGIGRAAAGWMGSLE